MQPACAAMAGRNGFPNVFLGVKVILSLLKKVMFGIKMTKEDIFRIFSYKL